MISRWTVARVPPRMAKGRAQQLAAGMIACLLAGAAATQAAAAEIVVEWAPPPGLHLTAASAVELHRPQDPSSPGDPAGVAPITGAIADPGARFPALAGHAYDLQLTLDDGTTLRGVNLNWYGSDPPDPDAGPTTDDDRKQILDIVHSSIAPTGFFNHADLLALRGSSQRAVALVQLVRDEAFDSGANGEIIWRVELWYLENANGGWIKVPQVSRMILRQRLTNQAAFQQAVSHLRWVPAMGDVEVGTDVAAVRVVLPPNAGVSGTAKTPATAPRPEQ